MQGTKHLFILLHGHLETADIIYKKIWPLLPAGSTILAPNGMFPIPQTSPTMNILKFSWYFYDHFSKKYFIFYDRPAMFIKNLITNLKLNSYKKTIIGYSQGGYLAPFVGELLENVQQVIGIGCNFKYEYLKLPCNFQIDGIHGDEDKIVDFQNALASHQQLVKHGCRGTFFEVPGAGHRLKGPLLKIIEKTIV